jgi:hypothetical protein
MTGRPPTTVQGHVKVWAREVREQNLDSRARLSVMRDLLLSVEAGARFSGEPDPHILARLAAHAVAWAEEVESGS